MALSTDLKIRGQYGSAPLTFSGAPDLPSGSSFAKVFSAVCQVSGRTDYEAYFQAASDTYQVPVNLLKAVAKAESDFTPDAVSHCGAQGIMQLMPATARSLGVTNAFDPAQNIMGGAKFLRQLLDRFDGNVTLAVAGYNAGPGAVQKYGGVPPYKETQNYVAKVLGYAGSDISIPASTGSAMSAASAALSAAGGYSTGSGSLDSLTTDELLDLVMQGYSSNGIHNKEAARLFLQKFLSEDGKDEDELQRQVGEIDDSYVNLKELVTQVDL